MIYFDLTQAKSASHRSGLVRVSSRLAEELGGRAIPCEWTEAAKRAGPGDWFLTAELFSEEERPGITAFLDNPPCRTAAIFHDAIPIKFPEITWPKSVARHPHYMALLSKFERVFAVSEPSREDLVGYWRWQGLHDVPPVGMVTLGADFDGSARVQGRRAPEARAFLCVGILEPRKNQSFLLKVCEALWNDGLAFRLDVVGRVNPHFGQPLAASISSLSKSRPIALHSNVDDAALSRFYANATATLFPTIAEGCGLPLLESLWRGVPCLASRLPSIEANAEAGGCALLAVNDIGAWTTAMKKACASPGELTAQAQSRALPTWKQTAERLVEALT